MNKEDARKVLEEHLSSMDIITLPVFDEKIISKKVDYEGVKVEFHDYTFIGLIKIAYGLKEND